MKPDPPEANGVSRRGFFQLSTGMDCRVVRGGGDRAAAVVRFLVPNVVFEPGQRFKAGTPDDYPDGSITFLEDERVFLVRRGNTFRCLSAVCTHLGCTVNRSGAGYHCPCHGSVFNGEGTVESGPAPRALTWFLVTLSKDNRLLVDKGQVVNPDKYLIL